MEIKQVQTNNVQATLIKTKKFKTITIYVVFLGEFSQDNSTKRSLLTRLLTTSTKVYNSKKKIANQLYDLYDAGLSVSSYPSYKTSVTIFALDIVNQKNLEHNHTLTKEAIKFLREVIFNPNVIDNAFNDKEFNEHKRILRENIKNIYNNKNRYALRQLLNHMCRDEIASVSSLGNLEDLEKITASDVYETYLKMINEENVSLYVVGDVEEDEILNDLKILGNFKQNKKPNETTSDEVHELKDVNEVVERQKINQSKLTMGFRVSENTKSEKHVASLLFNSMFGGTFQSDLIRVVREENSLAYTIASQIISDVKIMVVSAGIDGTKYEMTSDLIRKQLELYQNGQLNNENLELSKIAIINELLEVEDSPYNLINFALKNYLHDQTKTVESLIEEINQTTLDDIKAVASGVYLDTIFLLTSEEQHG